MTEIKIHASRDYTVSIGSGILSRIADWIPSGAGVCIVSDSNVGPIYGIILQKFFHANKIQNCYYTIPAGEASKNAESYLALLDYLSVNQFTRSDCIIALGGGVVGDLAGFAAATYLRGIPYIQVPTTLLAMVDSSVGGKTGIDLPAGKNLVGAFYQPAAVICDTDLMNTLPEEIFRDGCAEVIKYAVLYDPALFAHLEERGMDFDRERVITQCIEWKRKSVEQDELDRGSRMLLNLGHTIGHAIESVSNYCISHGQAVAIGIATVSRAAGCTDTDRILSLLHRFGLPTSCQYSAEALAQAAKSDKKRSGDQVHLIIPRAIGDCAVMPIDIEELEVFIKKGL
ncbi:MAG: 3-dehydroquinate synthase [Ruminococcaceae bacterium]|nr:3-dehydroquinate synthase [Oscillospiraceae bacterium]